MKHLKKYEEQEIKDEPQIGDYVVCTSIIYNYDKKLLDFLSNNIGRYIKKSEEIMSEYIIKFDTHIENSLANARFNGKNYRMMPREDIIFYSRNIKDCEAFLAANKYNL